MQCSRISKMCKAILQSQLGFPLLLKQRSSLTSGGSREPKIRLVANRALWFGSNVASDPAQLQIINFTHVAADIIPYTSRRFTEVQLVPGQDRLSLNARILDDLS